MLFAFFPMRLHKPYIHDCGVRRITWFNLIFFLIFLFHPLILSYLIIELYSFINFFYGVTFVVTTTSHIWHANSNGFGQFFYLFLLYFFIYLIKLTAFNKLNQVNNISLIYFFVFFNEYLDCINIFFNFKKIRWAPWHSMPRIWWVDMNKVKDPAELPVA
jgi:hypothetical protein